MDQTKISEQAMKTINQPQADVPEPATEQEVSSNNDIFENDTLKNKAKETLANMGYIPENTPADKLKMYAQICQQLNLDPFKKQVYLVARKDHEKSKNAAQPYYTYTIQISHDGYLSIAHRTKEFAGVDEPVFLSDNNGKLAAAKCTVWRMVQGEPKPFTAKVMFNEYSTGKLLWKNKPYTMLGKVARVHALRLGFPEYTEGLYTSEEMEKEEQEPEAKQVPSSGGTMKPKRG